MTDLPASDERTVVIGATGSGKTQFGTWLLSTRDFFKRPWFVLDFKGEKLFSKLAMTPFNLGDPWPEIPGLYWIRVLPGEEELVSHLFLQAYEHGNCGIFTDEGSMLPYRDRWIRACLTQGRSKNIELITLTQRPVLVDLAFFSEATYFSIFYLGVKDDRKRVADYTNGLVIKRLPAYHSLWYEVVNDSHVIFAPCPDTAEIIEIFQDFEEERQEEIDKGELPLVVL